MIHKLAELKSEKSLAKPVFYRDISGAEDAFGEMMHRMDPNETLFHRINLFRRNFHYAEFQI